MKSGILCSSSDLEYEFIFGKAFSVLNGSETSSK